MTDIRRLPVLSLSDVVVLPGMVVPIELDDEAQAAIDAAQAAAQDSKVRGPGEGRGAAGAPPGRPLRHLRRRRHHRAGRPAGRRRTGRGAARRPRARIGTGVSGPGAALWVEAELVDDEPAADRQPGRRNWPPSTRRW